MRKRLSHVVVIIAASHILPSFHTNEESWETPREEFSQLNSSQCFSAVHRPPRAREHGGAPRDRRIDAHMRPGRRQTTSTTMRGLALALLAAVARANPPTDCSYGDDAAEGV